MKLCTAICKNGKPCRFPVLRGSDFCFSHDPRPEVVGKRRQARVAGGRMHLHFAPKPATPTPVDTVEDIRELSFRVVRELREGTLDIKSANALSFACRTALKAAESVSGAG